MIMRGRVWCFGDNVLIDMIIFGRYNFMKDLEELVRIVFIEVCFEFLREVKLGDRKSVV